MSYPPPPNSAHNPGPGGGFGPPQGFGPPEQPGPPAGGYGYPGPPDGYGYPGPPGGPGQPGGYGPGGPGGPGGPFPPPPGGGGGGNGGKVAAIIIAAVVVAGLIVGGVLVSTSGDDGKGNEAKPSGSPSASADTADPSADPGSDPTALPSLDVEIPSPSFSPNTRPSDLVPYVVLEPGTCFDHPSLSSGVTEVEKRSCDKPHNGEVIANETLSGTFASETQLQAKVLELCKADAEKRLRKMPPDGRTYYYYAIYPALATYQIRGEDQISCSLTLSNKLDGPKLTAPLPK
ncbi:hypothetical protein [Streptomyces carminius]|uniref:hypothetical protein n=1 Tax=Streptomyces carminius TaxID=2665496 RepID=UPI0018EA8CCE|nr:hypothetical protein [Streptomyces carminius]